MAKGQSSDVARDCLKWVQLLCGENLVYSISQCWAAENSSNGFDHCVPVLWLPV